jgi:hypothetical protein
MRRLNMQLRKVLVLVIIAFSVMTQAKTGRNVLVVNQSLPIDDNGKKAIIQIVLKSGLWVHDYAFIPFACDRGWEGQFIIRVKMPGRKRYTEASINDLVKMKKVSFCYGKWKLIAKDYNGDGTIDFSIGQYGTSNGWLYWLFTISKSGEIKPLHFKDSDDDSIWLADSKASSDQIERIPGGLRYCYFNNGCDTEDCFGWWLATWLWDDKNQEFVLAKEEHYGENRPVINKAP